MLSLDEIREELSDRNLTIVAANCGVGYNTLRRILAGDGDPRISVIEKVSHYITRNRDARNCTVNAISQTNQD